MDLDGYCHFRVLAFPEVLRLRGKMLRNVLTPINMDVILKRAQEESLNQGSHLKRAR